MRLSDLKQGQTGIIRQVGGGGQLRQHFLDMGLIQGTEITYMKVHLWVTLQNIEFGDMN